MVRVLIIAVLIAFGAHHTQVVHLVGAGHEAHACVTCTSDTSAAAGLDLAFCLAALAGGIAVAARRRAAGARMRVEAWTGRGPAATWPAPVGVIPRPPPAPALLCVLRR